MGYAQKRLGRGGKPRYTAVYPDLRGERRSAGTFSSKKDANAAWQRAEAKAAEGLARAHDAVLIPVLAWELPGGNYGERVQPSGELRQVWQNLACQRLRDAFLAVWGHVPEDPLVEPHIERGRPAGCWSTLPAAPAMCWSWALAAAAPWPGWSSPE